MFRTRVISIILPIVTAISFVVAWPARDHELLSRLAQISDEKPVELYQEKLFYTTLTDCLRAAHKITLTGIRIVMNGAIDVLYAVPGSQVTEVPSWAPQFIRNVGPYLVLRAVVLAAIAFALY